MHGTIITTKNLILRHFTTEDSQKVFEMSRENSLRRWIPDQVYKDISEAVSVLEFLISRYHDSPSQMKLPCVLGITLKSKGSLIGHTGISPVENGVEIGYAIEEAEQGKGYATEAVRMFSRWALREFGFSVIYGIVSSENTASCRVLEKSGFVLAEEKMRNAFGRYCLCRIYSVQRSNFFPSGRKNSHQFH